MIRLFLLLKNKFLIILILVAMGCLNVMRVSAQKTAGKLVYSVATDGYVNVRQAPTAKSKVIGVLATGRKGAALLSSKGTWWKVRVDNVTGYVNSKYVQLSNKPVAVKNLPEFYYELLATCQSMKEVNDFFYNCPDVLDGSPVYLDYENGKKVYKICMSCHATRRAAEEACKETNNLFGYELSKVWATKGLAECVYLPMTPAEEYAIPLTPGE